MEDKEIVEPDNSKFSLGDFIQNKKPYPGEGEYLIVDYDFTETGKWYGYKCARMKGKYVPEHDLKNHIIIDRWSEKYYKKVG